MGRLVAGRRAEVTPSLPGFVGKIATVTRVDPVADAASDTFGARLRLANPDYAIPAGLRCRLTFLPPEELASPVADDEVITQPVDYSAGHESLTSATYSPAQELAELPKNTLLATSTPPYATQDSEESAAWYETPDVESSLMSALDEAAEYFVAPETDLVATETDTTSNWIESSDTFNEIAYSNECYRVGPLASESLDFELSNTVAVMDGNSQPMDDVVNGRQTTAYRVLTTSQLDILATEELAGYLTDNGVEDVYLLRSGEYRGRISVGFYGSELNAMTRQESLETMGVEVEILEVNRELSTYWIYLSFNSSPNSQFELQTLAMSLAPGASVQLTQCNQHQITRME